MRVIAGKCRRTNLVTPKGDRTRPTTDRIKETLFNMLQRDIIDCRFLDLFSGSGAIAIEALSRGAAYAVMVENDSEALRCIRENIKKTSLQDSCEVMATDVMQALRKLNDISKSFDIIFMDPPYRHDFEREVVEYLLSSKLVKSGTLIVVETSLDTDVSYMNDFSCQVEKIKDYKTNRHVFLRV